MTLKGTVRDGWLNFENGDRLGLWASQLLGFQLNLINFDYDSFGNTLAKSADLDLASLALNDSSGL